MADTPDTNSIGPSTPMYTTVYYQGQALSFHGVVAGTDCSAVTDPFNPNNNRIALVVTTNLSLTPPS